MENPRSAPHVVVPLAELQQWLERFRPTAEMLADAERGNEAQLKTIGPEQTELREIMARGLTPAITGVVAIHLNLLYKDEDGAPGDKAFCSARLLTVAITGFPSADPSSNEVVANAS